MLQKNDLDSLLVIDGTGVVKWRDANTLDDKDWKRSSDDVFTAWDNNDGYPGLLGNVGIGTANPNCKLDVNGTICSEYLNVVWNVSVGNTLEVFGDTELDGDLCLYGINENNQLNRILGLNMDNCVDWIDIDDLGDKDWKVDNLNQNVFTAWTNSEGYPGDDWNVGIGTDDPDCKLEVIGDACIDGNGSITQNLWVGGDAQIDGHLCVNTLPNYFDSDKIAVWDYDCIGWRDASTLDDKDWKTDGTNVWSAWPNSEGYPTGNVGIGSLYPPNYKLEVWGDAGINGSLFVNSGGYGGAYIEGELCVTDVPEDNNSDKIVVWDGSCIGWRDASTLDVDDLDWETDGTDVWTAWPNGAGYPAGNVGIGTSTPSCKLDVVGDVCIDGDGSITQSLSVGEIANIWGNLCVHTLPNYSDSDKIAVWDDVCIGWRDASTLDVDDFDWKTDGTDVWTAWPNGEGYPDGNVGIGTMSPDKLLTVQGYAYNDYVARFQNTCTNTGQNYGVYIKAGSSNDKALKIESSSGNPLLCVDGSGDVGIGTDNPICKLDIVGNMCIDGDITMVNGCANFPAIGSTTPGSGTFTNINVNQVMNLEPLSSAPGGQMGDLYVSDDGKLWFHNGTAWKEVSLL